jgi:hypothetical protein
MCFLIGFLIPTGNRVEMLAIMRRKKVGLAASESL